MKRKHYKEAGQNAHVQGKDLVGASFQKYFPGYGTWKGKIILYDEKKDLYTGLYTEGTKEYYTYSQLEKYHVQFDNVVPNTPPRTPPKKKHQGQAPETIRTPTQNAHSSSSSSSSPSSLDDVFEKSTGQNSLIDYPHSSSSSSSSSVDDVVFEKSTGQNPLIDYPHSRHLCLVHPWNTTNHANSCGNCYCYVCDTTVVICKDKGTWTGAHCHASKNDYWDKERHQNKQSNSPIVPIDLSGHHSEKFSSGELKYQEEETVTKLIRTQLDIGIASFHMKAFQQFLLQVPHGRNQKTISAMNVRRTISVVERLVAGQGVHYRHWPSNFTFQIGQKVTLESDLESIQQEARKINNRGGRWRDLGNGWAVNHPLQKMIDYRNYLESQWL